MLYKDVCKNLGYYLLGLMGALTIPFCLAAYYEFFADSASHPQPHTTLSFLYTLLLCAALWSGCFLLGKKSSGHLYRREGLISVVVIWFLTPAIAGAPFYFSGTLKDPFQAFFEATSGFSTTGATAMQAKKYNPETGEEIPIVKQFCGARPTIYQYWGTIEPVRDPDTGVVVYEGIEAVSKALLFWRSMSQWLGGMGIVVLFVAILPALGVGGKVLFQAETPGPIKDSLTPRIKETALNLWKIYLGLSLMQVLCLMLTNQNIGIYDALTITFSTMSTGGFTTKNGSIGAFGNVYTEWIVIIFMVLASVNFSLYFFTLRGKFYRVYEPEFILFLFLLAISVGIASTLLVGTESTVVHGQPHGTFSLHQAIRHGAFQISSVMTTTGFVTADYDLWPYSLQALMLILMFVGGMAGSTAGGMKVMRQYMLFKIAQFRVESLFRPEAVKRFKLGEREVDHGVALTVLVFFLLVVSIAAFSTLIFIFEGIDPETSLSLATLLINNVGIGFRMASPTESFAFLSDFALMLSSVIMIFGRLEFFAVLAVMVPAFWQKNR